MNINASTNKIIPNHIAIIMDGNGRWAKNRGQARVFGHKAGLKAVKKVIVRASVIGVKVLTLYAFSSENWQRSTQEVSALMSLFTYVLKNESKKLHKNNIKLNVVGDVSAFSPEIQKLIKKVTELTINNTGLIINVAANYGGRWDICTAFKQIMHKIEKKELSIDDVKESLIDEVISFNNQPAVDLVIRTGGDYRISNFLLWQIAYSELYFTKTLWPDFDADSLDEAITIFNQRERRFGGVIESK